MADKKISQLTPATLPLAGTELLPIVQSGTTDNITVNNLAAGNIKSNATTGVLQVTGPAAASTRVMTTPDANFTVARTDAAQNFTGSNTFDTTTLCVDSTNHNVGVGTASPNLTGFAAPILSVTNGASGIVELIGNKTTDGTVGQIAWYNNSATSAGRVAQILGLRTTTNDSGAITFQTASTGTLAEKARIDASGNFLVGNTSGAFGSGSGIIVQRDSANATVRLLRTTTSTSTCELRADVSSIVLESRDASPLIFGVSAAEKMRIASTGDVTVGSGNLVIGTSGKGIDFSATPGTGTSELLADYEEGTWTPTASGLTTVGSPTYTATYTKIGRMVTLSLIISPGTSTASSGGTTYFSGLPYVPASNTTCAAGAVGDAGTVNLGNCIIYGSTPPRIYTPTWSVNTNTIALTIQYQV